MSDLPDPIDALKARRARLENDLNRLQMDIKVMECRRHEEKEIRGRRDSPIRHTLGALRAILGFNQTQMASLLGVSAKTVQAIEHGNLKLSFRLANKIVTQTGIHPEWLLSGDPAKTPFSVSGNPYTKERFELQQAENTAASEREDLPAITRAVLDQIWELMEEVQGCSPVEYLLAFSRLKAIAIELASARRKSGERKPAQRSGSLPAASRRASDPTLT